MRQDEQNLSLSHHLFKTRIFYIILLWSLTSYYLQVFATLEQPHQLIDSLLKYKKKKKCSILYILTQKSPTSVFVKMSKYAQWSCKWTVTMYIYTITIHRVNNFFIIFSLSSLHLTLFSFLSPLTVTAHGVKKMNILFK